MFDAADAEDTLVPWSDEEEFNGSLGFDPFSMLSIVDSGNSTGLARKIYLPAFSEWRAPLKLEIQYERLGI